MLMSHPGGTGVFMLPQVVLKSVVVIVGQIWTTPSSFVTILCISSLIGSGTSSSLSITFGHTAVSPQW